MIIEYLSKIDGEILKVEPIFNYLKELEEVIQNKFNRFNDIEKDYLFEKHGYSWENVFNHLRKKLSFLEIINMVETKRNVKTKYENIEEKPHILLKKYS